MDNLFSAFITLLLVMDPLGNVPIFLAVLSFNLLGDGLRDALDPRFKI